MDEIIVKNTSLPLTFTTVPCTLTSCEKAICPPTPKRLYRMEILYKGMV